MYNSVDAMILVQSGCQRVEPAYHRLELLVNGTPPTFCQMSELERVLYRDSHLEEGIQSTYTTSSEWDTLH